MRCRGVRLCRLYECDRDLGVRLVMEVGTVLELNECLVDVAASDYIGTEESIRIMNK